MGILDDIFGSCELNDRTPSCGLGSVSTNRLGRRILEATGTRLRSTWQPNHYVPRDNIIYLNGLDGTLLGNWAKELLDRDQSAEMSCYHELGHAFVNVFRIYEDGEAWRLFGDFDEENPGSLGVLRSSRRRKREGYISRYAQEHPEEDFADCFAYIVYHNKNIGDEIRDSLVRTKLRYIQRMIKKYIR